jgi:hypothetical protein
MAFEELKCGSTVIIKFVFHLMFLCYIFYLIIIYYLLTNISFPLLQHVAHNYLYFFIFLPVLNACERKEPQSRVKLWVNEARLVAEVRTKGDLANMERGWSQSTSFWYQFGCLCTMVSYKNWLSWILAGFVFGRVGLWQIRSTVWRAVCVGTWLLLRSGAQ